MDSTEFKGILAGKKNRIAGTLIITGFCYFVFCITGSLCTFTDNLTISVVTGGMYGDNNFCQYIHPFLCLIIKILNPLLPTADVFMLVTHVFLLGCIMGLVYLILCQFPTKSIKLWRLEDYVTVALGLLFILWFVWGQDLFDTNYTVQTAALIFVGLLAIFVAKDESRSCRWVIFGTILIGVGFLYRLAGALLFLPFIGLEVTTELIRSEDWKAELRKSIHYVLPCLILIALLLCTKWAFISQEPYATDTKYTTYRTTAVDYPMKYWGEEGIDEEHTGVDQTTYENATNWSFVDTDIISVDALERIANIGSKMKYTYTLTGLNGALRDIHLCIMAVLCLILTIWNIATGSDRWLRAEAACGLAGGFIILLYFTFRGRALIRVWQCVLMAALCILIITTLKSHRNREKGTTENLSKRPLAPILIRLLVCVVLYFGVGQVMAHSEFHPPITPATCRTEVDDSMYAPTFEEDALYIWPNWYAQIPKEFSKQNKLPTQRVMEHNIAVGDWVYGQEYFRQFLKRIDAENPARALLERPHTYLVEGQNDMILAFMREHYGDNIKLKRVGTVNGKKTYQFVRAEGKGSDQDDE